MQKSKGLMLPEVDEERCNRCGFCIASCPGHGVDFDSLNSSIFQRKPTNVLLGNYSKCYVGHANDSDIRYYSSSGGIATRLLVFALERGFIDGVLVVKMKKSKPLEPLPFIARTKEEIISASKSKYCPVPINEALRQIISENGRYAVVGLPCHIHGVRKAERTVSALEKRIVLHVGLMCSHTVDFHGTDFLLDKMHIRKDEVTELNYRGMGSPGMMSIRCRSGSGMKIPYIGNWNAYWPVFSSFFFTPMRCLTCPDETNELADLSLGDAWLPEFRHERSGKSIIVTRTKVGEEILALAISEGIISVKPACPEEVEHSQAVPLKFKKEDFGRRLDIFKSLGKAVPSFTPKRNPSRSIITSFRIFFSQVNSQASSNSYVRNMLVHVPFPLFRLYYGIYKLLSMI
jgi:coenzyme F420 hydrogenase subunit beta